MKRVQHGGRWVPGGLLLLLVLVGCTPTAAPPPDSTTVPTPSTAAVATVAPSPSPTDVAPTATTAEPTTAPDPTEAVDLSEGIALYQTNGCVGCHTLDAAGATGTVGPTHNGVGTTAAERIADPDYTGSATTAEEYLRESIETPTAYTVPGFPEGVMPSFASLSEEEKDALVALLLAQQ